jgi:hypothetical protein
MNVYGLHLPEIRGPKAHKDALHNTGSMIAWKVLPVNRPTHRTRWEHGVLRKTIHLIFLHESPKTSQNAAEPVS